MLSNLKRSPLRFDLFSLIKTANTTNRLPVMKWRPRTSMSGWFRLISLDMGTLPCLMPMNCILVSILILQMLMEIPLYALTM